MNKEERTIEITTIATYKDRTIRVNELLQYLFDKNQKYKEVIDKAMKYIQKMFETGFYNDDYYLGHLKQILQDKEVEDANITN